MADVYAVLLADTLRFDMRFFTNMIRFRTRAVNLPIEVGRFTQMSHNTICNGRTADISKTNKQDFHTSKVGS